MSEPCPCADGADVGPGRVERGRVSYGDDGFVTARRALLTPLAGETALTGWRPGARADLLVLMLEWWAYLAEVAKVYAEQSVTQSLLGTARGDRQVGGLTALLGYQPRPAVAATAHLGVLASRSSFVPAGSGVDSKPPPGAPPQRFELDQASVSAPAAVAAMPPGDLASGGALFVPGKIDARAGEHLLILKGADRRVVTIASVAFDKDARGSFTRLTLASGASLPAGPAAGWQLLRSGRSAGLWGFTTTRNRTRSPLEFAGPERSIAAGDAMVLVKGAQALLVTATSIAEEIWYANGDGPFAPFAPAVPIPMPHARIGYSPDPGWTDDPSVRVLLDWRPFAALRDAPRASWSGVPARLVATDGLFPIGDRSILIEGADGRGVLARGVVSASDPRAIDLIGLPTSLEALTTPLRVLFNVVRATGGRTVAREILGSGDAARAMQSFVLAKAPLTYFQAGPGVTSTLEIRVGGIRWHERDTFYGAAPDDAIYVLAERDDGKTVVTFGDGENGARLPSGVDNVVARYRYGAGPQAPAAGTLTTLAGSIAGVTGLVNPVAATGAAAGESASAMRRFAPRSVLAFDRAVSGDDYAAIAARAPGVARVKAIWGWSAAEQRATVTILVGDDPAAVAAAQAALRGAADPNRPFTVRAARKRRTELYVALRVDPDHDPALVEAAVRARLTDTETGLLSATRRGIGQSLHQSELAAEVHAVPGVRAIDWASWVIFNPLSPAIVAVANFGETPVIVVAEDEYLAVVLTEAMVTSVLDV